MNAHARAAVILAAGKGTRMKSEKAKVLHHAAGRPLVAYPVERALALGCDPVVVVVGHQGDAVRKELEALFPDAGLRFAVQHEQRGTAHAVGCAREALEGRDGRLLILYGDTPLLREATLERLIEAGDGAKVAFLTFHPADPTGYGRVLRSGDGEVAAILEHKDAGPKERAIGECNGGIYDADLRFLLGALGGLSPRNAQGELYLTDVIAAAAEAGQPAVAVEVPTEEVAGVNDLAELASVSEILRRRRLVALMRAGVTLVDPATTWVDGGVELAPDVILEPMVRLTGRTRIGAGTRVGLGSVIHDSEVGAGVELKPYCVLEEALVGERSIVGPFARLRPGTELSAEVHIGNFVETKKAKLGRGAKANHLSYLGDATIGARCNVGAGTITCNYDGVHKHPTVLGDDVFIGSDTQLVAPVRVGDGAYVGAGSTITSDVPAGALALTRASLTVKEGWVARRKAKQAGNVPAAKSAAKAPAARSAAKVPAKRAKVPAAKAKVPVAKAAARKDLPKSGGPKGARREKRAR